MNLRCVVTICLALAIGWVSSSSVATAAPPASDAWFGSTSKPAANGVTQTKKSSWLPSWPSMPSWTKPKPKATNKPSMLSSVSRGTKKAWNNTTSFLNPFDNPPKASSSPAATAANSSSWFKKPDQPDTTKHDSLSEFIGQKKPEW